MPTADVCDRLIILHRLLTKEMIRNARPNAVKILKEIAAEAKLLKSGERLPDAPTADPKIRIEYWNELFQRAWGYGETDTALHMLREIRKESTLCN
jgi:hypothetical protein